MDAPDITFSPCTTGWKPPKVRYSPTSALIPGPRSWRPASPRCNARRREAEVSKFAWAEMDGAAPEHGDASPDPALGGSNGAGRCQQKVAP